MNVGKVGLVKQKVKAKNMTPKCVYSRAYHKSYNQYGDKELARKHGRKAVASIPCVA